MKSICILSFSPIERDARVLRQIKYLSQRYSLFVIGYGESVPAWSNGSNIHWLPLYDFRRTIVDKAIEFFIILLAKCFTSIYPYWYWRHSQHREAMEKALKANCDAYHANDWEALPIAAEIAVRNGAYVIFDAHEYAPLEYENRWYWFLFRPAIHFFLTAYLKFVEASTTVAPLIAQKYHEEYGISPIVVLNAPDKETLPIRSSTPSCIRLIHHGSAKRDRGIDTLIETLSLCDERYILHFMFTNSESNYVKFLTNLAEKLAPGRVEFLTPVSPERIVRRIAEYDLGIYLLQPKNFNNKVALPNKFFDYISAGLAVCVGPSPSMANIVTQYKCGCVAPSFEPADVAKLLNALTRDQLIQMKEASRDASKELNAKIEMAKVIKIYTEIFNEEKN